MVSLLRVVGLTGLDLAAGKEGQSDSERSGGIVVDGCLGSIIINRPWRFVQGHFIALRRVRGTRAMAERCETGIKVYPKHKESGPPNPDSLRKGGEKMKCTLRRFPTKPLKTLRSHYSTSLV